MTHAQALGIDLPEAELLAGLAEECTELAQAALKLRRVLDGSNPTPVSEADARAAFQEELDDVATCLVVLGSNWTIGGVSHKLNRWGKRLSDNKPKGD